MNKIYYLSCLLLLFLFTMCKENVESQSSQNVLYPLKETVLTNDLKSYIEKMEFIEIPETPETMLADISKMLIDKSGNIFTMRKAAVYGIPTIDGKLISFVYYRNLVALKSDGTFLFRIEEGRGRGEYLIVYDFCLSEDGEELMILDKAKIMCYGIKDRTRFREIKNIQNITNVNGIAPAKDGGAYLFAAHARYKMDPNKNEFLLKRINKDGEIVGEYLPQAYSPFWHLDNITQFNSNRYYLNYPNNQNIVYEIAPDTLKTLYKIDFQDQMIPSKYYHDNSKHTEFVSAPYYKMPVGFKETKDNLFFHAINPDANQTNFVYSISKSKGINWLTNKDDPKVVILASDDEYFYATIFNHDIEKYKSDTPDVHGALFRIIAETMIERGVINSENGNPVIVKIKFKI